ncbi:MAG TPA: transglutaminase-like domain-containing protein [Ktedonobacteraceae bacterium]|nr:transglutaminase-like domain-containing protein [Ktedonobacteraceae bacterium]
MMPEESLNQTPQQRARSAFEALITGEDTAIDLAKAALLIAAEEYPDLNIAHYLTQLDMLAQKVYEAFDLPSSTFKIATPLAQIIDPLKIIGAMNKVLFKEERFLGNRTNYYDPCNSFLNDVLERHKGIPITLSIIYIEVGKRLGLQIMGIGLPFHFIVRCDLAESSIYIDPFERGHLLSEQDCRERISSLFRGKIPFNPLWLEPVSNRQLLTRVLTNLKNIYIRDEDYPRALAACDRIVLLAPDTAIERKDRGIVHHHLKHYTRAIRDFNTYLELAPLAEDADDVRRQIKAIRQTIAMLN